MATYWLSGVKESYIEQSNGIELGEEQSETDTQSEYHSNVYQNNERRRTLHNVINKSSSSSNGQCPFTGI